MDDSSIIALFNSRDENALAELSAKYGGICRGLISRILTDNRDSEECFNSVLMRLWSSIPPAEPRNLGAYVAKAARNEALMMARKKPRRAELPIAELEEWLPSPRGVEDDLQARSLNEAIYEFLKRADSEKRAIFLRRYWFLDPVKEIASRYKTSEGRVKSILFRTRKELRKYLEQEGFFHDRRES